MASLPACVDEDRVDRRSKPGWASEITSWNPESPRDLSEQKRCPKRAVLGVTHIKAENLAAPVGGHAHQLGIIGHEDDLTNYSPDAASGHADAARAALGNLDMAEPVDDIDKMTIAAMRERPDVAIELHDALLDLGRAFWPDQPGMGRF